MVFFFRYVLYIISSTHENKTNDIYFYNFIIFNINKKYIALQKMALMFRMY